MHNWTANEDKVSFYLSKFGNKAGMFTLEQIANVFQIDVGSLKMRVANFKALAGNRGLNNAAIQSREIFEAYKDLEQNMFEKEVVEIIESTHAEKVRKKYK
jgi:hypothetical protein